MSSVAESRIYFYFGGRSCFCCLRAINFFCRLHGNGVRAIQGQGVCASEGWQADRNRAPLSFCGFKKAFRTSTHSTRQLNSLQDLRLLSTDFHPLLAFLGGGASICPVVVQLFYYPSAYSRVASFFCIRMPYRIIAPRNLRSKDAPPAFLRYLFIFFSAV